jgi:hypothetical protein
MLHRNQADPRLVSALEGRPVERVERFSSDQGKLERIVCTQLPKQVVQVSDTAQETVRVHRIASDDVASVTPYRSRHRQQLGRERAGVIDQ